MSSMFSEGIVDLIDERWEGYDYKEDDVVAMVARIVRPASTPRRHHTRPTEAEKSYAIALLAACD